MGHSVATLWFILPIATYTIDRSAHANRQAKPHLTKNPGSESSRLRSQRVAGTGLVFDPDASVGGNGRCRRQTARVGKLEIVNPGASLADARLIDLFDFK